MVCRDDRGQLVWYDIKTKGKIMGKRMKQIVAGRNPKEAYYAVYGKFGEDPIIQKKKNSNYTKPKKRRK